MEHQETSSKENFQKYVTNDKNPNAKPSETKNAKLVFMNWLVNLIAQHPLAGAAGKSDFCCVALSIERVCIYLITYTKQRFLIYYVKLLDDCQVTRTWYIFYGCHLNEEPANVHNM